MRSEKPKSDFIPAEEEHLHPVIRDKDGYRRDRIPDPNPPKEEKSRVRLEREAEAAIALTQNPNPKRMKTLE